MALLVGCNLGTPTEGDLPPRLRETLPGYRGSFNLDEDRKATTTSFLTYRSFLIYHIEFCNDDGWIFAYNLLVMREYRVDGMDGWLH